MDWRSSANTDIWSQSDALRCKTNNICCQSEAARSLILCFFTVYFADVCAHTAIQVFVKQVSMYAYTFGSVANCMSVND